MLWHPAVHLGDDDDDDASSIDLDGLSDSDDDDWRREWMADARRLRRFVLALPALLVPLLARMLGRRVALAVCDRLLH